MENLKTYQIKSRFTTKVLFELECNSLKICVEKAVSLKVNLYGANLSGADLYGANLSGADLSEVNLYGANLYGADLRGADLIGADLRGADLIGADLDFSAWPLSCKSFNVKADDRLVAQLIHHVAKLNTDNCSGGVKESIKHIRKMAISDLFCEYRNDIEGIEKC